MNKELDQIKNAASAELEQIKTSKDIEGLNVKYLGRKGVLTLYLREISNLPAEKRPQAGKAANVLKKELQEKFKTALNKLKAQADYSESQVDVTLPGRCPSKSTLHPITQVMDDICQVFERLGFTVAEGPEIELDYYNFEALNFPKEHPARDMQDTFFVSDDVVLRTHTSPMQVRVMEKQKPPVRAIAPGKVFRCDSDITHTPMFHQVEGLLVDEGVTLGDLKGILTTFIHHIFDDEISLRFRPSFFPFTEPSAEVDILCVICRGKGCRVCSNTGWLEVLGAGMVHPNVFENIGYDTSKITGFAFGMGVERIAMLKYQIDDIRKFFDNDLRFLGQF